MALTLAACKGGGGGGGGDGDSGDDSADDTDGEDGDDGDDGEDAELPAPSPRVYRLTHQQWENTVQDLFRLATPTGLSQDFRDDPLQSGFIFDNNVEALSVDEALWTGYRIAAGEVADQVTGDPAVTAWLFPPPGDELTRRITFVTALGERAFRRPISDTEVADYAALFDEAPPLYPDETDPFTAGARLVIEAMLQSPHFLYRMEESTTVADDVIPLTSWEVASRLSYFLWNSMPDDELFDAARVDGLVDADMVELQALRMIEDPRALAVMTSFHEQMLEVDKFEVVNPSPAFFPDADPLLGEYARTEAELFLSEVLVGEGGSLSDLFLSPDTHVNEELAQLYGIEGVTGPLFTRVTLDPSRRAGLFTQTGFLAHNASSVHPDPIHRGVFMAKRMVCLSIAAPPDNVPPLPPVEGGTNRQTVEMHTEQEGTQCISCHKPLINPYGFTFEHYDAVGAWRDLDNGLPVDSTASVFAGGEVVDVDDAVDMMAVLANSQQVHDCYARHWLEYAGGRPLEPEDIAWAGRIGIASLEDDLPIAELVVGIVTSKPFLNRATEELP